MLSIKTSGHIRTMRNIKIIDRVLRPRESHCVTWIRKDIYAGEMAVTKKSAPLVAERTVEYNATVPFRTNFK